MSTPDSHLEEVQHAAESRPESTFRSGLTADDDTFSAGKYSGANISMGSRYRSLIESIGRTGRATFCH